MSTLDEAGAGETLRAARPAIAADLAALVADWPKYAASYAADAEEFAQLQSYALVDFMARLIESGDENYRHLYVGEKAKQLHDPTVSPEVRREREAAVLAGERKAFVGALQDDPVALERLHAEFDAIAHALTTPAVVEVKALLIGDCLHLDVVSFLTAPALADGVRLEPTFVTSHDAGEIKAQLAALADQRFDVVFYSPFTYALLSDYEALQRPRSLLNPLELRRRVTAAVASGAALFDVIADLFDCPIVAHVPAPLFRHGDTADERLRMALTAPARHAATRRLAARLRASAAARVARGQVVHLIDERIVAGRGGLDAAGRFLYQSWLQHPAAFGAMLAPWYRDILFVVGRLLKRKLVACDLDNTLWRGVIGEGLGVTHHYDRQAPLLTLKERGIVLAINSKNDSAKAVWRAEPGRLARDDFVSQQINWDPKPLNMRRIAEHLNLKEKDFVFIDDRADERALVEEQFPAMVTLDALDPRSWRLLDLWAQLLAAKAGADRTDFYRQRDARQAFIAAETEQTQEERASSLASLDLKLTVRSADQADVARVTDLINRTNQFNTTGGRITKKQVDELIAAADAAVLIADAADRFGAMGTIGVLIVRQGPTRATIDPFVLSCRVFGYGMEFALLEQARRLTASGALFGPMTETPFNQPCRDVYRAAGFTAIDGGWILGDVAGATIPLEPWLTVATLD